MADGLEETIHIDGALLLGVAVVEHGSFQLLHEALLLAEEFLGLVFPQHLDVGRVQNAVLHGLGGTKHVTADDEIDLVAELGQIGGIFAGRVAAANHRHVLAFVEEAVASGASGNAAALEFFLGGQTEITCRRTRGNDDTVGQDFAIVFRRHLEGALADIDARHLAFAYFGAKAQGLLTDFLHHFRAGDSVGITRKILDFGGLGKLSAGLHTLINDSFHVGATRVDGCCVACRARANYQTFNVFHILMFRV